MATYPKRADDIKADLDKAPECDFEGDNEDISMPRYSERNPVDTGPHDYGDSRMVLVCGKCHEPVLLHEVRRLQRAIETAEAWVRGEVGEAEIKKCLLAFGATSRPSGKSANDAAYYAVAYTQPWTSCIDYVAYSAATAVATAYPYVKADAQERRRMRFMAKAADITRSVVPWSAVKTALRKRKKP